MEFIERKNPPKWLSLPGWPNEINYKELRQSFPVPIFVLVFGSAVRAPARDKETARFLWWSWLKEKKRYANDVDFLVVTKEEIDYQYRLINGLPYRYQGGDSYGMWWCYGESPGAMHLQVATIGQIERAIQERDVDVLRILSSSEIIEGDVSLAKSLMAKAG